MQFQTINQLWYLAKASPLAWLLPLLRLPNEKLMFSS